MYQSPVASIAELISNSWDADAENVNVSIPDSIIESSEIIIKDDGVGMTLEECETKFLKVGHCRRGRNPTAKSPKYFRPILGRKGIGKLAGFGIAKIIEIDTTSEKNGERVCFQMNLDDLRGEDYIGKGDKNLSVIQYEPPFDSRKKFHGTTITLRKLTVTKWPPRFENSMARRFLLKSRAANFNLKINGNDLNEDHDGKVQFDFPKDFTAEEILTLVNPDDFSIEDGWANELLANGSQISWRILFYDKPINEEELRGISVFANGKLAQTPFIFQLAGGLSGQHGLEYISGQVQADYLDELAKDIIAPERQRVAWDDEDAHILLLWGQNRVKALLTIWKARRGQKKLDLLDSKIGAFNERLKNLTGTELTTVRACLSKIAGIESLTDEQYLDLGMSVINAWEKGRLRGLIDKVASASEANEEEFLQILIEANVLDALHTAEAVKTKIEIVDGLRVRIEQKEIENKVRDYISEHPWLIGPKWETFQVERSVKSILKQVEQDVFQALGKDVAGKRIDLILSSGTQLLVLEFMQPGLAIDNDHLNRFETYVRILRESIKANSAGKFNTVTGFIVADRIEKKPYILSKIQDMRATDMFAMDWGTLLDSALAQWDDFLEALSKRDENDPRLKGLNS